MNEGFYKVENDEVIYAPNFVYGPYDDYRLFKEEKDTYDYPVDGWYWFETPFVAYQFFGREYNG